MFTVGERVAAGRFPLWLAVVGFEVIAALGTTAIPVRVKAQAKPDKPATAKAVPWKPAGDNAAAAPTAPEKH